MTQSEDLPGRLGRLEDLFHRAAALGPQERAAFLARECSSDTALREEVERLLRADAAQGDPIGGAVRRAARAAEGDEADRGPITGRRLGPYSILRKVGEGGMGAVYLAVRDDDTYRKEVALKMVPGGARSDLIARFRAERRILASLDHPNVARILDGGADDDGTPWVAMEFVDGQPLDRYCRERAPRLEERLELFLQVCEAVAHAHRNLVVHRDLKPGNILVTPAGAAKLLDFGIAKLLEPERLPEAPPRTDTWARLLTPEYASPEQIRGDTVTTASDVYALGVILYELLAGVRPYELDRSRPEDAARTICEVDPPSPSVASRAADPRPPEAAWARRLEGDLDTIVLVALRKEPSRRYPSAERLADDIRRYLDGLPVSARPDTWTYRTGKFVRRHRLAVAAASAAFLLLAGFGSAMAVQAARLAAERDAVVSERSRAEQTAAFLLGLFEAKDEGGVPAGGLTARDLLDRGVPRIEQELAGQPELQAALLETVGRAYRALGELDAADPLLERSLALRQEGHGPHSGETAASLEALGELAYSRGQFEVALERYRSSLDIRTSLFGENDPRTAESIAGIAAVLQYQGKFAEAEPLFRRAWEIVRASFPADDSRVAQALGSLAGIERELGRLDAAEASFRELVALARRTRGDRHLETAEAVTSLAQILRRDRAKWGEAEPLYRESIETRRALLGEHTLTAQSINNFAVFLKSADRAPEAEPLYHEALGMYRKVLPADHPTLAIALANVASFERDFGDRTAALGMYEEALGICGRSVGPGHWMTFVTRSGYAQGLEAVGRASDAEREHRAAVAGLREVFGEAHPRTRSALKSFAEFLDKSGKPEEARSIRALLEAPSG